MYPWPRVFTSGEGGMKLCKKLARLESVGAFVQDVGGPVERLLALPRDKDLAQNIIGFGKMQVALAQSIKR
eukprot:5311363-Alexandrium_andersonii.AAC.1